MRSLLDGVRAYETTKRIRYSDRFAALADGQDPLALFITCSDSRVVPSLVALANPGELFVVRNVANLVPRTGAGAHPDERQESSASSAIWYAIEVLKIRDIVVCGHSGCGGVKAMLGATPPPLRRWLDPAKRAITRWREEGPLDPSLSEADQLSQLSTLQQLDNLTTHDYVRARVESRQLKLHAWWFDIPSARLLGYSKASERYVPILEAFEHQQESSAAE